MKRHAFLLGFCFLLSKIAGIVRDNLLASSFGATSGIGIFNLDTYYAAFRLPDFLFNLLSYGVLGAAFVPLFTELIQKEGKQKGFNFSNEILYAISSIVFVISVILFAAAPFILRLFVPGFAEIDFTTTVLATRIMLITPLLFTIGSIFGGIQNSLNTFWGLAMAPILYNSGIILGIIFLSPRYGVYGISMGVSFGALLHMLIQIPAVYKNGFRLAWIPLKEWWSAKVKEMLILSLPRIFGMSVTQLSLTVDTILASTLATGSIAIINFASNLESLPISIIGISVAIVSFGTLSSRAAAGDMQSFIKEISDNLRRILFLLIPLTLGIFTLRFQIVRLLLGRGKFTWTDTILTANTLGVFLSGLLFGGIVFLLARAFYALKDTRTPVFISVAAVIINILLSIILINFTSLGTFGLALANSVADILNAALLLIVLSKKLKAELLDSREIFKFFTSAAVMTAATQLTKMAFGNIFTDIDTYAELILQTAVAASVGAAVYFGICWALRCVTIRK